MKTGDKDSNFHLPNHLGSFISLSLHSSEFDGSESDDELESNRRAPLSGLLNIMPEFNSPLATQRTAPKNHQAILFASAMTVLMGSKLFFTGYGEEKPALVAVGSGVVGAGLLIMYNLYNNPRPNRITTKCSAPAATHRRTPTPT